MRMPVSKPSVWPGVMGGRRVCRKGDLLIHRLSRRIPCFRNSRQKDTNGTAIAIAGSVFCFNQLMGHESMTDPRQEQCRRLAPSAD